MNISEDKFENKSANQIVQDVLLKHQNNTQDALNYIQNISTNDGLSLSKETIDELKKAEDILNKKIKRESLIEAWWPFKKKEKTYRVTLTCYPPFKKEPVVLTVEDVKSLDDPRIQKIHDIMRKMHPYSAIHLDSELGRKTFYGNSLRDYKVNAYDKDGNKTESFAGTLPIAMGLSEKLYDLNECSKVDILKDDKIVSTYKGLEEGWAIEEDAKKTNDGKIGKLTKKDKDKDLLRNIATSEPVQTLATVGLSGATGIFPGLVKDTVKAVTDYAFDMSKIDSDYRKEKKKVNEEEIKEDKKSKPEGYEFDSFVDIDKDIADLNERKLLCACDIHPEMKSNRYRWKPDHQLDADYVVLDGIKIENNDADENGNKVKILLKEKIPVERTIVKDGKVKDIITYVDGKKRFEVNLNYFKAMINSKANEETKTKFDKKYPESTRYMEIYDDLAKAGMEKLYLDWMNDHFDSYKLDRFDEIEKFNIYNACKDHELTPEEVDTEFFFPKLAKQLEAEGTENVQMYITAIKNTLRQLPNESDKNKLREKLGKLSNDILNSENKKEIENTLKSFVGDTLPDNNVKIKIDDLMNGKVSEFENKFLNDQSIDDDTKNEYLDKKAKILEKFMVSVNGIDTPVFNQKIYQYLTKSKKNLSDPKKEMESLIGEFVKIYNDKKKDNKEKDQNTDDEVEVKKVSKPSTITGKLAKYIV